MCAKLRWALRPSAEVVDRTGAGVRGLVLTLRVGVTLWQWRTPATGWHIDEAFCCSKKKSVQTATDGRKSQYSDWRLFC